jgi:hypothetical protein
MHHYPSAKKSFAFSMTPHAVLPFLNATNVGSDGRCGSEQN